MYKLKTLGDKMRNESILTAAITATLPKICIVGDGGMLPVDIGRRLDTPVVYSPMGRDLHAFPITPYEHVDMSISYDPLKEEVKIPYEVKLTKWFTTVETTDYIVEDGKLDIFNFSRALSNNLTT